MMMINKYNFVYKTTNLINGKYYIGVHSTNDIDDGYLGSGDIIKKAIIKYGKHNFNREILIMFDDIDSAFDKEAEIVNEDFINNPMTYNICLGGFGGSWKNKVLVKDEQGQLSVVFKNDPNYQNGLLTPFAIDTIIVKTEDGNRRVSKYDPNYIDGTLKHVLNGKVTVKNSNNIIIQVDINDPEYLNGNLKHITSGKVPVKDLNGNTFQVDVYDERYISGELVHVCTGITREIATCPHCGKSGSISAIKGWHFEYCKYNPNRKERSKTKGFRFKELTCPYCGKKGRGGNMKRYHFDNCKSKK